LSRKQKAIEADGIEADGIKADFIQHRIILITLITLIFFF
jgi:hypothetical protein